MADDQLIIGIRHALAGCANAVRAEQQQRYMKSALPFRGVDSPTLKATLRPLLNAAAFDDRARWEATVRELWDGAEFREERYAAIALARHRRASVWQDAGSLPLYRHMVVTGAWWDHVDEIAAHLVGAVLMAHRGGVTPTIRQWMVDGDMWVRRCAVLSQLRHGNSTDTELLHDAVEANVDDTSFWLRKAIGWALREYSYVDPAWVEQEVGSFDARMSGLSRREALKRLTNARSLRR